MIHYIYISSIAALIGIIALLLYQNKKQRKELKKINAGRTVIGLLFGLMVGYKPKTNITKPLFSSDNEPTK